MDVSIDEAQERFAELVRYAEAGDEVVLTREGEPVVKLMELRRKFDAAKRRAVLEAIGERGRLKATPGPSAARSQDFLYDENGLPK